MNYVLKFFITALGLLLGAIELNLLDKWLGDNGKLFPKRRRRAILIVFISLVIFNAWDTTNDIVVDLEQEKVRDSLARVYNKTSEETLQNLKESLNLLEVSDQNLKATAPAFRSFNEDIRVYFNSSEKNYRLSFSIYNGGSRGAKNVVIKDAFIFGNKILNSKAIELEYSLINPIVYKYDSHGYGINSVHHIDKPIDGAIKLFNDSKYYIVLLINVDYTDPVLGKEENQLLMFYDDLTYYDRQQQFELKSFRHVSEEQRKNLLETSHVKKILEDFKTFSGREIVE